MMASSNHRHETTSHGQVNLLEQTATIIQDALTKGQRTLSEFDAKRLLGACGVPVTREVLVTRDRDLVDAAARIGYPLVLKGCLAGLAHKTEKGLVRLGIRDQEEAESAFRDITWRMPGGERSVLVQEQIGGNRELAAGMIRDPQFGPCVMFGLGGVFVEVFKDVSFRVAPLERVDALEMMREIRAHGILGPVRGEPAAHLETLADILVALGRVGMEHPRVREIDINPLVLSGGRPVAVDALVTLEPAGQSDGKEDGVF